MHNRLSALESQLASGTDDVAAELKTVKAALELAATSLEVNAADITQLRADLKQTQALLAASENARAESEFVASTTRTVLEEGVAGLLARLKLAANQTGSLVPEPAAISCADAACTPSVETDGLTFSFSF